MWNAFVLAFAACAAISDAAWRKIPRSLMVLGAIAGLAFHMICGGFWSALLAAAAGFLAGLLLFAMGAIGGGDVKLIAAVGALLGWTQWLAAMEIAVFAAGAMALIQAYRRGLLGELLANIRRLLYWRTRHGIEPHPSIRTGAAGALQAPFGVAVAVGVLFAVVRL